MAHREDLLVAQMALLQLVAVAFHLQEAALRQLVGLKVGAAFRQPGVEAYLRVVALLQLVVEA